MKLRFFFYKDEYRAVPPRPPVPSGFAVPEMGGSHDGVPPQGNVRPGAPAPLARYLFGPPGFAFPVSPRFQPARQILRLRSRERATDPGEKMSPPSQTIPTTSGLRQQVLWGDVGLCRKGPTELAPALPRKASTPGGAYAPTALRIPSRTLVSACSPPFAHTPGGPGRQVPSGHWRPTDQAQNHLCLTAPYSAVNVRIRPANQTTGASWRLPPPSFLRGLPATGGAARDTRPNTPVRWPSPPLPIPQHP